MLSHVVDDWGWAFFVDFTKRKQNVNCMLEIKMLTFNGSQFVDAM